MMVEMEMWGRGLDSGRCGARRRLRVAWGRLRVSERSSLLAMRVEKVAGWPVRMVGEMLGQEGARPRLWCAREARLTGRGRDRKSLLE